MPAKAGIQCTSLDSRLRGNDNEALSEDFHFLLRPLGNGG
jgi:hypothetical protein